MPKKQAVKVKAAEPDPIGDLMTPEFIERSFKKAVVKVHEDLKKEGLDRYFGTPEGEVFAEKPDGRIEKVVFNPPKNHG